jgi:glycosyltransferase involved in cell wall biosynthesis
MATSRERILFISWAPFCSRSDNIARELGGRSVMIYHSFWGSNYFTVLLKYLTQSVATLLLLLRVRPKVVFVMSPPSIVCLPVLVYTKLFRARMAIDAHSATFNNARWQALQFLQKFLSRQAASTIVTTPHWQQLVRSWDARSDIVQDVPVLFPSPSDLQLPPGHNIAVVCTFTFDEPIECIFRAAALTPEVQFHITGNARRASRELLALKPDNVRLTGFLPDADYVALLQRAEAVMCLTTLDHTMQRAAYEAAYLGRPIITSDFPLLRQAFPRATVFVRGEPEAIARGVREMCQNSGSYAEEAQGLRAWKLQNWQRARERLQNALGLAAP